MVHSEDATELFILIPCIALYLFCMYKVDQGMREKKEKRDE